MEKWTLFHGSTVIVNPPLYGYGRRNNDYGRGFYCTQDQELAKEWACQTRNGGFCNEYVLDAAGLKIINLNEEPYHVLNWLAVLVQNRRIRTEVPIERSAIEYIRQNYLPETRQADLIRGYRADDSYFSIARNFLRNAISVRQLSRALHLGGLGEQVFLQSAKSFAQLAFVRADPVPGEIYYPKRSERDATARKLFQTLLTENDLEGIFIRDILRGNISDKDIRMESKKNAV